MICPICNKNAKTIQTSTNPDGSYRQRYECQGLHRFTFVDGVYLTPEAKLAKQQANARKAITSRHSKGKP